MIAGMVYCAGLTPLTLVQISDFGLSHMYANGPILTKTVGTVCYAAPELLTSGLLTRAADVYSFGTLLAQSFFQHGSVAQWQCLHSIA